MHKARPFNASSTADQVLAGIDLSGRRMLVTGCTSGIGYETMSALTANGAHVIGLGLDAAEVRAACAIPGAHCTPVACDLGEMESVHMAAQTVLSVADPLDVIIANAAVARVPLAVRGGVEAHFAVNHLGHFALIDALLPSMRDGGRIVVVGDDDALASGAVQGIHFDNLDGAQGYEAQRFYAQSKLANGLFAQELSRRLRARGITVNVALPGATRGSGRRAPLGGFARALRWLPDRFLKSAQQGAATQCLLAGSPSVAGVSGETWADCVITKVPAQVRDEHLAAELWRMSAQFLAAHLMAPQPSLQHAA